MTTIFHRPGMADRLHAANLLCGKWTGNDAVCMMAADVPGAHGIAACVTAGWPEWLADLNIFLFDSNVGVADELSAAITFALGIADAVSAPFDADKARDLFLIRRLDTGDHSALKSLRLQPVAADWWLACEAAIVRVVELLRRRLAGDDVANDMKAAATRAAAYAAARAADAAYPAYPVTYAAARAATRAADAAAYAAAKATRAAAYAAARAADAATRAATRAADAAAYAAAKATRADLIWAINESRIVP